MLGQTCSCPRRGARVDRATVSQSDSSALDRDVERLTRDLADATEQQAATSEILQAIGRSVSALERVFETVLHHAVRLCRADAGQVFRLADDGYRIAVALGGSEEYRRYLQGRPLGHDVGTLVGRVGLERRVVHIEDAAVDPRYQWREARALGGFHTLLGVPMIADDRVLGVIVLWRTQVDPFDDRTIELMTTFASHGVIAIQNVQLFQELQRRSGQLARSVDELHALGETTRRSARASTSTPCSRPSSRAPRTSRTRTGARSSSSTRRRASSSCGPARARAPSSWRRCG